MTTVNVFSPSFDSADSYGRVASELSAGVEALGGHVNCFGADAPEQTVRLVPGGFVLGYPTGKRGALANVGVRVAVTMFESNALPEGWVGALNGFNRVIVPSQFCKQVFEAEGVESTIDVVPLGVNDVFMAAKRRVYSSPFTVLIIADRGQRKGWWEAMLAFHRAFGDDPNVRLIVKSRGEPLRVTNANVEYVTGDLTEIELRDLYYRAHVMLFPGREGYGLPPREFAATGGVALALDWGGTQDDLERWGFQLPVSHHEVAFQDHPRFNGQVGTWGVVDVEAMATALQVVQTYYAPFAARAMRNAAWISESYRWSSFAAACWDIYHEAVEEVRLGRNVS